MAASVSYIDYDSSNPTMTLSTIQNLISSDLPVTFALDANQFCHMGSNNVLTSEEYNSDTEDHAQTIVGYNNTMTVAGSTDIGAFKVVNSWGTSFGDQGYYWITYEAFEKIGNNLGLTYITNKASYQPKLIALWQFNSAPTRSSTITVGVGTPGGADKDTPFFVTNNVGVGATFPTFMALDVTGLMKYYQNGITSFYLTLGTTTSAGIISSFRIEEYQNGYGNAATQVSGQSPDVPKANPGSVTVSMPSYSTIAPKTALDNSALNITGSGDALWSPEVREYYAGSSAMQSGDIGDGGKSDIQTFVAGPATVSFWWKTSTQATDKVSFYVDSVPKACASNLTTWTEIDTIITSGTHILKWEYAKGNGTTENQDLVLLDDVQIVSSVPTSVPGAPISVNATSGSGSISIGWSAPAYDGGSAITGYNIYRGSSSGCEALLVSLGPAVLAYADTSAVAGTTYYYRAAAVNSVGISNMSSEVCAKISSPTVPDAPINLTSAAIGSYVTLSWTAPADDGGSAINSYSIFRGTSAGSESTTAIGTSTTTTYTDTTVVSGIYYYVVKAISSTGTSSSSNEAHLAIRMVPSPPTNLTATQTTGKVALTWTAPLSNGSNAITGYSVYRWTNSTSGDQASTVAVMTTSYTDATAQAGRTYHYSVEADNLAGPSAASASISVIVAEAVPGTPDGVSTLCSDGMIQVSWSAPVNDGGSAILGYKLYRSTISGSETFLVRLGTVSSYNDTGLTNGDVYYYRISAINSVGEGALSVEVLAMPSQTVTPPGTFTLIATAESNGIRLNWTIPFSGGSPILCFSIIRTEAGVPKVIATMTSTVTAYIDPTAVPGENYTYSVVANNAVGSTYSSSACINWNDHADAQINGLGKVASSCCPPSLEIIILILIAFAGIVGFVFYVRSRRMPD
jgi:fibronectin type 3 domain-containing protein